MIASSSGLSSTSSSVAPITSKVRFSAKSMPSNTGGPSSNSGTDCPGTNSARWIRISIVEGARRTRTPRRWHWSTSSTASSWGNSGSAMITSSMRSPLSTASRFASEPSERRPLAGKRLRGEEADDLDRHVRDVRERVGDVDDVGAAADQHRASLVAGGAQQHRGHPLEGGARRGDVEDRKRKRAPEQVVAGEVFAADDGEDQRHERDLEQRADDPREPWAQRALRVQARAREQQRGQQVGERQEVFGGFARVHRLHTAVHGFLEHKCGEDRERHPREVEREQRSPPASGARRWTCAAGTTAPAGACGGCHDRSAPCAASSRTASILARLDSPQLDSRRLASRARSSHQALPAARARTRSWRGWRSG